MFHQAGLVCPKNWSGAASKSGVKVSAVSKGCELMGRSIAAHPAAGRHLGDDGFCYAVDLNVVSNFFEFRALVMLAEVGTWAPSLCGRRSWLTKHVLMLAKDRAAAGAGLQDGLPIFGVSLIEA